MLDSKRLNKGMILLDQVHQFLCRGRGVLLPLSHASTVRQETPSTSAKHFCVMEREARISATFTVGRARFLAIVSCDGFPMAWECASFSPSIQPLKKSVF